MLTSLSIKNYALIEDIQMDLQSGFTIITGETGAGKSIMLGALSLLLGKRADYSAIRDKEKKCVIEGSFNISSYDLKALFAEEDLDFETQTIIRREILPSGKSRAFINDTPANLSSLQVLGERLLDIHSQHETLSLGDNDYQFLVIDSLAANASRLKQYQAEMQQLRVLQKQLQQLREEQAQATKEYDYNLFLLTELQQAKLVTGMQEELEERYEELSNVEQLTDQLGSAVNHIQQEEIGAAAALREAKNNLQRISGISGNYQQLFERLQSLNIELDDIATELESALDKVEANPAELEQVNARLQVLYNLQKKHAVATVDELKQIEEELVKKVAVSENAEEEIAHSEKAISEKKEDLHKIATDLHAARKSVIPKFVKEIETILADLGMPNATLKIELEQQKDFFHNGQDKLNWLLAANKGGSYNEIKKAASGGELSRIMLAVKSILATYSKLPTIIFDEIDTGVSGDIAQKMAGILQKMGKNMQVIAITHLPQIAGKGDRHFKIYKEDAVNSTITNIKELRGEERVEELAMMLGGKNISDSAVAHAKALLN
ncbi:DNA repair protein RecN [Salinimicrobium sp. MT39]|uniref:DNA repair protein RecN n=1 Tax=Salinimicrobium profundisediminis TaxID=2994553 RepID=A0A9X3CVH9_9FLAO|nr:DNA repair protein RecN [Salinimicrobium profundisediminis]MCX2837632.1 DNA repair protein RecN [Salinimicrobium profundisediminis]